MLKEEVSSLHHKLEEAQALRLGDASAAVDALAAAQAELSHTKTDFIIQVFICLFYILFATLLLSFVNSSFF